MHMTCTWTCTCACLFIKDYLICLSVCLSVCLSKSTPPASAGRPPAAAPGAPPPPPLPPPSWLSRLTWARGPMPARSCIVTLLTLALTAVAGLCSIGKIGHVHFAEDPSKSAVLASVCCPETCGRCGGVDCWSQPGGLDCCAKHVYDLGLECTQDEETGCVLPKPTAMVLPAQQRERSCLDMWSAAFPNEREVPCHPNSQPAPAHATVSGRTPCAGLGQEVL